MHGACVLQYLPVLGGQPRTVPQYQRRQARLAALGIHSHQALANRIAPGTAGWRQALAVLDRAGGANTLGQQPSLVVKSRED